MPAKKPDFEIVEHTADVGVRATGVDLPELVANVARGMCSIVADPDTVRPGTAVAVRASGDNHEDLMVHWLNELLYIIDAKHFLFCDFTVESVTDTNVKAKAWGEELDHSRHDIRTEVKAATYHELSVKKQDAGWTAFVLFDI